MSTTKDDGDWTVASPDGNYTVDEPFFEVGDSGHKVILWPHMQDASDRTPLALDTAHPDVSTAYLVNEFGFQDVGGGIDRWFREYATIPASRIEFTGTEVFKFPGLPPGAASGASIVINSITGVSNGIRLNVTDAGTIEAGDSIRAFVTTSQAGFIFSQSGTYRVLTGSTSTGIIVGNFPTGSTFVSGSLFEVEVSRTPFSQITPTLTRFEYFLPGVTASIADPEDIEVAQPFRPIVEETGAETEFLTDFTSPSVAQYRNFIVERQFLVISSKVERYKGNIYVRETKYVRAI